MKRQTFSIRGFRILLALVSTGLAIWQYSPVIAEDHDRQIAPNYKLASQFSTEYVRQFLYDTSVNPNFIGKSDVFWYSYRTSEGTRYYRVNPSLGTKEPLFNHVNLSAKLSELAQKPLDSLQLVLQRPSMNDEGTKLKFVFDDFEYEYELNAEKLTKLGKAPAQPQQNRFGQFGGFGRQDQQQNNQQQNQQNNQQQNQQQNTQQQNTQQQNTQRQTTEQNGQSQGGGRRSGRGGSEHRNASPDGKTYAFAKGHNLYVVDVPADAKKAETPKAAPTDAGKPEDKSKQASATGEVKKETATGGKAVAGAATAEKKDGKMTALRAAMAAKKAEREKAAAEAKKAAVASAGAAKTEVAKTDVAKTDAAKTDATKVDATKVDATKADAAKTATAATTPPTTPPVADHDNLAVQLSKDGVEDYSFAGFGFGFGRRGGGTSNQVQTPLDPERKTRPNLSWSTDSKAFYISRGDSRDVQELWVLNSLSMPRPTLEKYKYAMPGEEKVRKAELYYYSRDSKKLNRVPQKWRDESFSNIHWGKAGGSELRFLRQDRLLRNVELCSLNTTTGEIKCLLTESVQNASIFAAPIRYIEESDEMIWWSERSGWGHFYLYDRNGNLKNQITAGPYRANRIVDIDSKNRVMYFTASGREPGENVYFEHLYKVQLDGTMVTLLDAGNSNHRSTLSPTKQFIVDNFGSVSSQPASVLRDASGKIVMELQKTDLSKLFAIGWKLPETFTVKAADGVTDLYGNMWKPFDFDPTRKYPIIAHVYPGPQMEGTTHTFSALGGEQQLAQIGFIVIQVGHRGGAPNRSKAYASYGYFNLRDYGLADKKAAIEQLAARFPYVDIDRVGIYGHSGGGFMTAAALLQKPYNDFFKVGVSTAGNHDNNIYNNLWAERYHGLKEVEIKDDIKNLASDTNRTETRTGTGTETRGGQRDQNGQRRVRRGAIDDMDGHEFEQYEMLNENDFEYDAEEAADESAQDTTKSATDTKAAATKTDVAQNSTGKTDDKKAAAEKKLKFDIAVPTNAELAGNLKGRLLLIHGESDNNVHPANTLRLVDALIKANKRFDMMFLPATRHGFGAYQPYVNQRMYEYFAEHLLGDYQPGAEMTEKQGPRPLRRNP